MLWLMAKYANGISQQKKLGILFQAIVPRQMVLGTGIGDAAANAGIEPEEFVARFGAQMSPREFGEKVVSVLVDPKYASGVAFGLNGGTEIAILEEAAVSCGQPSPNSERVARLLAAASELRPELHRYCARLMGSVIDGEDAVQDTLAR